MVLSDLSILFTSALLFDPVTLECILLNLVHMAEDKKKKNEKKLKSHVQLDHLGMWGQSTGSESCVSRGEECKNNKKVFCDKIKDDLCGTVQKCYPVNKQP